MSSDDAPAATTHVPFPAAIALVDSHPRLPEGASALRVRTDAVPADRTAHLSCTAAGARWNTPDGALDFVLPADDPDGGTTIGEGGSRPAARAADGGAANDAYSPRRRIVMERIIPISSIDHASRGGDAWDVLRQSTGLGDRGCRCDAKVHGFSDRLLRFDVATLDDAARGDRGPKDAGLRCSYAGVRSFGSFDSVARSSHADIDPERQVRHGSHMDCYTTESVISKLNAIVLGERVARKRGVAFWMRNFARWTEECLSLGVLEVENPNVMNPSFKWEKAPVERHEK